MCTNCGNVCVPQNNQFRAFLRQAGVYNPTQRPSDVGLIRPPMEAYRGTAIAVVDNPVSVTYTHTHIRLCTVHAFYCKKMELNATSLPPPPSLSAQ